MRVPISTKGWESLPKLQGISDWADWDPTIRNFIRMAGFGAALTSDDPTAQLPSQGDSDYRELVSNWSIYQSRFVRVIIARTQGRIRIDLESPDPPLKPVTTVYQAMERLAAKARTPGLNGLIYLKLVHRWETLSLSQFDSMDAYATEYNNIHTTMVLIDKSLKIPEPLLIARFLRGLGDRYRNFTENFFQNNRVIPICSGDVIITPGISLSTAISHAKDFRVSAEERP